MQASTTNSSQVNYVLAWDSNADIPGWSIKTVNGQPSLFYGQEGNIGLEMPTNQGYGNRVDDETAVWNIVHDLVQHHHNPEHGIFTDEVTAIYIGCNSFSHIPGNFARDISELLANAIACDEMHVTYRDSDELDTDAIDYIDENWDSILEELNGSLESYDPADFGYDFDEDTKDTLKLWLYEACTVGQETIDKFDGYVFDNMRYNLSSTLASHLRSAEQHHELTVNVDFDNGYLIQIENKTEAKENAAYEEGLEESVNDFVTDIPNQIGTHGWLTAIAEFFYQQDAQYELDHLLPLDDDGCPDDTVEAWEGVLNASDISECVTWLEQQPQDSLIELAGTLSYDVYDFDY